MVERECAVVLGCPIDRLGMDETVQRCRELIEEQRYAQQISVNAAKLVALREDPRLRRIVLQCDLINADGQSVIWASRVLRDPLPERVAGIDLMNRLLTLAEDEGYRVYFLGARDDVLLRAVARIKLRHPRLTVAGWRDGYFGDDEQRVVRDEIRAAAPHILFVAISSPRKEYWVEENAPHLGPRLVVGVGGSLDVVAGLVRRAPRWMQRLGLEWAFRLIQEPRQL
jgi:N-acetylglucosaminyldiphosphoundecaprenol N-acetyl-beta-D-mannosaminyltransferase